MKTTIKTLILMAAVSFMAVPIVAADSIDGAKLFNKKCKMCHAVDKKKSGPAIKTMSQDEAQLSDVITNGGKKRMMKPTARNSLQMRSVHWLLIYAPSRAVNRQPSLKKRRVKKTAIDSSG